MAERYEKVEERVSRVLKLVTRLRDENGGLKRRNEALAHELAALKRKCQELEVASRDQTEAVKSRLTGVLTRIEELEHLSS
jgi:FtsZ-binding cell division protein ZapB